jgi:hypothetical protein
MRKALWGLRLRWGNASVSHVLCGGMGKGRGYRLVWNAFELMASADRLAEGRACRMESKYAREALVSARGSLRTDEEG